MSLDLSHPVQNSDSTSEQASVNLLRWESQLKCFEQELDVSFEMKNDYNTNLRLSGLGSSYEGAEILELTNIRTPTTSNMTMSPRRSPTSSVPSTSSASLDGTVWDSPQTPWIPFRRPDQTGVEEFTPFTPPSSPKQTFKIGHSQPTEISTPSRVDNSGHTNSAKEEQLNSTGTLPKIRNFQTILNSILESGLSGVPDQCPLETGLSTNKTVQSNSNEVLQTSRKELGSPVKLKKEPTILTTVRRNMMFPLPASNQTLLMLENDALTRPALAIQTGIPAIIREPGTETIFSAMARRAKTIGHDSNESRLLQDGVSLPASGDKLEQNIFLGLERCAKTPDLDRAERKPTTGSKTGKRPVLIECQPDLPFTPEFCVQPDTTQVVLKERPGLLSSSDSGISFLYLANLRVENDHQAVATSAANSEPDSQHRKIPKRSFENLDKVLEKIIPAKLLSRMSAHPGKCVATQNNSQPCRYPSKGSTEVAKCNIKAIEACIKNFDYINFPSYVEILVRNTTCGRHTNVALSQPMKAPRILALQDVVLSLPNISEANSLTFRMWLKAISKIDASYFSSGTVNQIQQATSAKRLSSLLNGILPFGNGFGSTTISTHCVVSDCKILLWHKPDVSKIRHSTANDDIDNIVRCMTDRTFSDLPDQFRKVVSVVMCRAHQLDAFQSIEVLQSIIRNLANLHNHYISAFDTWIKAITKCDMSTMLVQTTTNHASPPEEGVPFRAAAPVISFVSAFAPFTPILSSTGAIADALRSAIGQPLTKQDLKKGFIYMFWDQQNFGMVKIGRTNNLERRLKEWNKECKVTHYYHHSQESKVQEIPHVSRIEKLMHIELGNFRRKRKCNGCGRLHKEWFEIGAVQVLKVFQKWRTWILKSPYSLDGNLEWKVKPEMLETMFEVCQPTGLSNDDVKTRAPHRVQVKGSSKSRRSQKWPMKAKD